MHRQLASTTKRRRFGRGTRTLELLFQKPLLEHLHLDLWWHTLESLLKTLASRCGVVPCHKATQLTCLIFHGSVRMFQEEIDEQVDGLDLLPRLGVSIPLDKYWNTTQHICAQVQYACSAEDSIRLDTRVLKPTRIVRGVC